MQEHIYSSIRLEITSQCNINCAYCHNSDYAFKKNDMTTDEILQLIKNLKSFYPIKKVLLTGGEPLLNNGLINIINLLSDLKIKSDLVTNGKLLTKLLAQKLIDAGLSRIRLSIDGFKEHRLYRVGSDPNKLWKIAEWLVKRGDINVCIHTVASPHNIRTLHAIYNKVILIGAHRWRVFDIGFMGSAKYNKSNLNFEDYYNMYFSQSKNIINDYISNQRYQQLNMDLERIFVSDHLKMDPAALNGNYNSWKSIEQEKPTCSYIAHQLTIRSDGIGTLCQYFHNPIYDFKKYSFNINKAISNAQVFPENNLLFKDITSCINCQLFGLCGGGCRNNALSLTGDILDADPIACYLSLRRYNEIKPILPLKTKQCMDYFYNKNGYFPKYTGKDLEFFLKKQGFIQ